VKQLRGFAAFLYDFIIGDDWKIAAGVALALATLAVLVGNHALGDRALAVLGGLLVAALFIVSLLADVFLAGRRAAKRDE
jgi:hypothetical protein